jgi:hypothetical protein
MTIRMISISVTFKPRVSCRNVDTAALAIPCALGLLTLLLATRVVPPVVILVLVTAADYALGRKQQRGGGVLDRPAGRPTGAADRRAEAHYASLLACAQLAAKPS